MSGDDRPRSIRTASLGILILLIALAPIVSGVGAIGMIDRASAQDTSQFNGHVELTGNGATSGTSWTYDVSNLSAVSGTSLTLTGDRITEPRSRSTTTESATLDLDPRGTSTPANATMRLTGQRGTTAQSAQVSGGDSISVGGNTAPESESITIKGAGSTESKTASGTLGDGGSDAISVGGNAAPSSESITLSADYSESSGSTTGTNPSVGGSLPPTNEQITIESDPSTSSFRDLSNVGDNDQITEDGNSPDEMSYDVDTSDVGDVGSITASFFNYPETGGDVAVYVDGTKMGQRTITKSDQIFTLTFDSANNVVSTGDTATIKFAHVDGTGDISVYLRNDYYNHYTDVAFTTPEADSATVDHPGGQTTVSTGSTEPIDLNLGANSVSVDSTYGVTQDISWTERNGVSDPSVSVGSSTVSHDGILDGSVTKTVDLSRSDSSISASYSGSSNALDYDLSWTEDHRAHDPSVTIDGSTVSHTGPLASGETETGSVDLSTGSSTVSVSSTGSIGGVSASWTEITTSQNPSIELDGGSSTLAHAGTLSDGQTVEEPISLTTGSHTASISSDGPVDAEVVWDDVSETKNPTVDINGNTVSHSGALSEGETVDLSADVSDSWIQEGGNSVSVSMDGAGGGPEPQTGLSFSHDAETIAEIDRTSNTWEEETDIYRKFASDQDNVSSSIPLPDNVVEIDQVSVGGSTISSDRYQLDGTNLEIDIGSVTQGEEVSIFARGSKVRAQGGAITVTDPTSEGDVLNTSIAVESVESGEELRVDVSPTVSSNRIHRATSTSWGSEIAVRISSDGSQKLLLSESGASAGSSATLTESSWTASTESGDIDVIPIEGETPIRDQDTQGPAPRLNVSAGAIEGDQATVTYHDAQSGEEYQIRDVIDDRVVERSQANSPVSFSLTDQSGEYVLEIAPDTGDALAVGGGGSSGGALGGLLPPWLLLLLGVGGAIGFLGLSSERGFVSRSTVILGAGAVVVVALEVASPVSVIAEVRWALVGITSGIIGTIAETGIGVAAGGIALILGVWFVDGRTDRSIPLPLYIGSGALAVFWLVETVAPGAITEGRLPGVEEIGPLIWIALIGGTILLIYRWLGSQQTVVEIAPGGSSDD